MMENSTFYPTRTTQSALRMTDVRGTSHIYFRIPYAVLMVLLFITTLASGVFVMYTMRKHNMLKKKAWVYLLILTVADTGICLQTPFIVIATVKEDFLRYRVFCIISAAVLPFFSFLSVVCCVCKSAPAAMLYRIFFD